MHYYVTLTNNCNLRCKYCYEKCCKDFGVDLGGLQIDYSVPSSINYDLVELEGFCEKDPDTSIVFYGGEPLLRIDLLEEVMERVVAKEFILQTNGLLLDQLDQKHLKRLDAILVSVDGGKDLTDHYRGEGIYERVFQNLRLIRERGFVGEVIARMTVGRETRIDREVWSLLSGEGLLDSVHWQLDALFWHNDYDKEAFSKWAKDEYNPGVRSLIDRWVEHMKRHGEVLRIYPLIGITQSLLQNEPTKLRCGAGWAMFNIQTDGKITPCPVMAGMKDFYLGDIRDTDPSDLASREVSVSKPCTDCSTYSLCGGRCLYANVTKLWGEEGFELVCGTVRELIDALRSAAPAIQQLISERRIALQDFHYPKYNSCEIIP
jgi:putative peptide-modifying radical SAM enzyme